MPTPGLSEILFEACASDVIPVLGAVAVAWPFAQHRRLRPVLALVAFIAADDVVALVPLLLGWNPGHWNWIGQSASLLFSLLISSIFLTRDEVGLRLPRARPQIVWTIAAVFGALAVALPGALLAPVTWPDAETFAYEATLPGLVEELVFRGIGLALLLRAFSADGSPARLGRIVAALATALWFTAGHVLHLQNGHFQLRWSRVLDVLPMSLWYVLVRLRSGSLLGGVLAHNAANVLVEALAAIRT